MTIANNTIYGHSECLSIGWSGATGVILADNAVYCPGRLGGGDFGPERQRDRGGITPRAPSAPTSLRLQ